MSEGVEDEPHSEQNFENLEEAYGESDSKKSMKMQQIQENVVLQASQVVDDFSQSILLGSPREEESPGRSVDLDIPSTYLPTDTEIERQNEFEQTVLKIEQFDQTVEKIEI